MPNAIPAIAIAAAKWATAKIIVATGIHSLAFAKAVYATVYVATTALAYAGVSALAASALKPSLPNAQRTAQPFNSTNPDWQWGYGWRRIAGPHMAWHHLDGFNIEVQSLHHGPISAYGQFYFHDDKITFDPVTGETVKVGKNYGPKIRVFSTLGTTPGTANFPAIVALAGPIWTTQHRLDGCAAIGMIYGAVSDENVLKVYPKGPPVVSVVANLSPVWDPRKDSSLGVPGWSGSHRRDNPATWEPTENAFLQRMHNDWHRYGVDFDYRIAPTLAAWATAFDRCDTPRPLTSGAAVLSASAAAAAPSITLTNVSGIEAGSEIDLVFPDETVTVASVAGLVVTLDAPLALAHDAGTQARWAIDGSMGLTEPRWRCGIMMTGANDKAQVRARFMEACDGIVLERADGAWVPNVELYEEPGEDDEFVLTERHILSAQIVRGVQEDQRVNEFSWKFSSPDHGYMPQAGEPWRDEADIAARGEVKSVPVDLEQVPSHLQGRELLSRRMYRANCDLRLVITTDGWGQVLRGRRWFRIKVPSRGTLLANLVVECVQDPDEDLMRGRLTFRVARSGPELASFNPLTQGGTPPGSSYRPPPPELPLPSIVSVTPYAASDGTRLAIVMDDPGRDELQYRVAVWQGSDPQEFLGPFNAAPAGADITIATGAVPQLEALNVAVATTVAGETSEYVDWPTPIDTRPAATPLVDLDFLASTYRIGVASANHPSDLSDWTFTRALAGYGQTAAGALTSFATGVPRITDRGLLVEAASTNLVINNGDLSNASWTKTNVTVTTNTVAGPNGATTADTITENTANNAHGVTRNVTATSGQPFTSSFYVKPNGRTWCYVSEGNGVGATAYFNLSGAGSVGTVSGTGSPTALIFALANGWYRVTMSFVSLSTPNVVCRSTTGNNTFTHLGDGASGLHVWGGQGEQVAAATSAIDTAGASVTRPADEISIALPPGSGTDQITVVWDAGSTSFARSTLANPAVLPIGAASAGAWVGHYIERVTVQPV